MHAFDVLGDPVRRRILELLAEDKAASGAIVEVISEEFGITQSAVSQQLKILRESGFATVRAEGARRIYAIDSRPLAEVDAWLNQFRRFWGPPLEALATEIARGKHVRRSDHVNREPSVEASMSMNKNLRVFRYSFASVYPLYVQKAEKKGRTRKEVDEVIAWLTGYKGKALQRAIDAKVDLETFFARAPRLNPNAGLITGVVCGVRVEDIEDPLMQKIRYLDKLIDELAKGKKMASILREQPLHRPSVESLCKPTDR